MHDAVRGEVRFANDTIEDFVLLRGNGTPIFLLANVVDDVEMGITHVLRAEEHLPNTPKQQLLWEALGHQPAVWAHVPVLVNESRKKLSKRRDKVALEAYRDEGYLADAMVNYLMTLGWAPKGDTEIVPWSVIEDEFRIEDVTHSPAFFDVKKLTAFNGDYIRALSVGRLHRRVRPVDPGRTTTVAVFARIAPELQSRAQTLAEVPAQVDFLFATPVVDEASWDKAMGQPWAGKLLDGVVAAFETAPWDAAALEAAWREVSDVGRRQAEAHPGTGARRRDRADQRATAVPVTRRARSRRDAGAACASPASGCRASDDACAPTTRRSGRSGPLPEASGRARPPGARRRRSVAMGAARRRCSSSSWSSSATTRSRLFQVWSTGRSEYHGPADAIVVMGAAQYDGRPSPQLAARLDHVVELWPQGLAPLVVVTGGKRSGDRFTEAEASAPVPGGARRAGRGRSCSRTRARTATSRCDAVADAAGGPRPRRGR